VRVERSTRSVGETEALGEAFGREVRPGDVLALVGDLGSGKTAFVRGLARGMGSTDRVSSPTYTLMAEYGSGRLPLHHFDAYLAEKEMRFLRSGALEYFYGEGVAVVEWGDRIEADLPSDRLEIRLEIRGEEERLLRFRGSGARSEGLLGRVLR